MNESVSMFMIRLINYPVIYYSDITPDVEYELKWDDLSIRLNEIPIGNSINYFTVSFNVRKYIDKQISSNFN